MGGWEERKFNAFKTPRRMLASIFNRFQVIRSTSWSVGAEKTDFSYPLSFSPPPVTVFLSELKLENPTPKTRDSMLHDGSTSMILR